jgi:diguanylate cyclase (GGDEF)-like protein
MKRASREELGIGERRDTPARLLIVDDDRLLRGMAARTLRHAGFEVTEVASGEEALVSFEADMPDLVLLDLMMPGLNGYEVCRHMREQAGDGMPIVMLTGLDDTDSIDQAYQHGATDFITKPINWTLLSHRVRYALRASRATQSMRRSRESLARAQRMAGMGNWSMFGDGRMDCSSELMRIFGFTPDLGSSPIASVLIQRVLPSDREILAQARARLLADGVGYQMEYRIERPDGAVRTLHEQAARIERASPNGRQAEGITQDISDRVRDQERIRRLAHYCGITSLPNRQFFNELAGRALDRARRHGRSCAVLHVDIDRFQHVNDAFGRTGGDAVLKVVADRLRQWTRSDDVASSNGGDADDRGVLASGGGNAFSLLIADLDGQDQATLVAQRLIMAVAQPMEVQQQSVVLTVSIGIAFFPSDANDLPSLARCAEQAARAAKDAGRGQHRFFDENMNAHAANRLRLEAELRQAIVGGELRLHYQPKVDARSGALIGAEALVRWERPGRGLVPPGEFIPLAEETGLVLPMTDWILDHACGNLRAWAAAGLPRVPLSINLAASSLADLGLVDKLDALMERYGLAPQDLVLEMTETMLMNDVSSAIVILEKLRARGFGLSLDDFGTGYSSLSYLKRLPMSELKIDRAFITDAARGGKDAALASAIIALACQFEMQVVAEGVETPEQSAFLLARGCHVQQGYLFSRPVPGEQFERLLRDSAVRPKTPVVYEI